MDYQYETEVINFYCHGYTVSVEDSLIAEAVAHLSEKQRDIILLSFFLEQKDIEVAMILGIVGFKNQSEHKKCNDWLKNAKQKIVFVMH